MQYIFIHEFPGSVWRQLLKNKIQRVKIRFYKIIRSYKIIFDQLSFCNLKCEEPAARGSPGGCAGLGARCSAWATRPRGDSASGL